MSGISGYGQNNFANFNKYNKANAEKLTKGKAETAENEGKIQAGGNNTEARTVNSSGSGNYRDKYEEFYLSYVYNRSYEIGSDITSASGASGANGLDIGQIKSDIAYLNSLCSQYQTGYSKYRDMQSGLEAKKQELVTNQRVNYTGLPNGEIDRLLGDIENLERQLEQQELLLNDLEGRINQAYGKIAPYAYQCIHIHIKV